MPGKRVGRKVLIAEQEEERGLCDTRIVEMHLSGIIEIFDVDSNSNLNVRVWSSSHQAGTNLCAVTPSFPPDVCVKFHLHKQRNEETQRRALGKSALQHSSLETKQHSKEEKF